MPGRPRGPEPPDRTYTALSTVTRKPKRAGLMGRLSEPHERLGRGRGRERGTRCRVARLEAEPGAQGDRVEQLQDGLRAVRDERLILRERLNGVHVRRAGLYFSWAGEEEARRRAAEAEREEARRERGRQVEELSLRLGAAEGLLRSVLEPSPGAARRSRTRRAPAAP